jgi:hypothetical protein
MAVAVEKTLAVLGVQVRPHWDDLRDQIVVAGFTILREDRHAEGLDPAHYPSDTHHLPPLAAEGPCCVMVLAKPDAVTAWHRRAAVLRMQVEAPMEAIYASATPRDAARDLRLLYPHITPAAVPTRKAAADRAHDTLQPALVAALTALAKAQPPDPPRWLAEHLLAHRPDSSPPAT